MYVCTYVYMYVRMHVYLAVRCTSCCIWSNTSYHWLLTSRVPHRLAALMIDLERMRQDAESYSGFLTANPDNIQFKLAKLSLANTARSVADCVMECIPDGVCVCMCMCE